MLLQLLNDSNWLILDLISDIRTYEVHFKNVDDLFDSLKICVIYHQLSFNFK